MRKIKSNDTVHYLKDDDHYLILQCNPGMLLGHKVNGKDLIYSDNWTIAGNASKITCSKCAPKKAVKKMVGHADLAAVNSAFKAVNKSAKEAAMAFKGYSAVKVTVDEHYPILPPGTDFYIKPVAVPWEWESAKADPLKDILEQQAKIKQEYLQVFQKDWNTYYEVKD